MSSANDMRCDVRAATHRDWDEACRGTVGCRATWGPVGRRRDADTREQPADPTLFYKQPGYSPYASRNYAERLYFGDENPKAWSVDVGGGVANARSRGSRRGLHGTNISPQ